METTEVPECIDKEKGAMGKSKKLSQLSPGMQHGLYTTYRHVENTRARFEKAELGTEEKYIAREKWLAAKKKLREYERRIGVE